MLNLKISKRQHLLLFFSFVALEIAQRPRARHGHGHFLPRLATKVASRECAVSSVVPAHINTTTVRWYRAISCEALPLTTAHLPFYVMIAQPLRLFRSDQVQGSVIGGSLRESVL